MDGRTLSLSQKCFVASNKSNRVRTIDAFSCILVLLLVLLIVFLLVVLYYYYSNIFKIVSHYRFLHLIIDILLDIGVFS